MKSIRLFLTTWLAMALTISFAQDPAYLASFTAEGQHKVLVQLSKLDQATTRISVLSPDGTIRFSDHFWNQDRLATWVNFLGMDPSDYLIMIKNKNGWALQPITIMDDGPIELLRPTPLSPLAPAVNYRYPNEGNMTASFKANPQSGTLSVNLTNLRDKPVTFYITSFNGAKIYKQLIRFEKSSIIEVNLKNTRPGNYFAYLRMASASVWQTFTLGNDGRITLNRGYFQPQSVLDTTPPILSMK